MKGEIDRSLLANLSIKYEIMSILNSLPSFFFLFKLYQWSTSLIVPWSSCTQKRNVEDRNYQYISFALHGIETTFLQQLHIHHRILEAAWSFTYAKVTHTFSSTASFLHWSSGYTSHKKQRPNSATHNL